MRTEKNQVQVIARAAAILRALEQEPEGLSLGQLAGRLDLARSTVQRIVAALGSEQLVMAASPTGRVRLGPALLRLAASVETDVAALVRPFIAELSAALRETVDFAAIRRDHLTFIDQVVGPQRLRTVSAVGETFPLYCTANGKAFLAELDDGAVERLVGRLFEARTPQTLRGIEALLTSLKAVRREGVAFDLEEHTVGICAAGVALRDVFGSDLAISVPVPTHRFHENRKAIAMRLLATKRMIDEHLRAAAA